MVRAIVNPEETHTQTQGEHAQKHHKDSNQSTGLNQTPNPTFSNDDMILKSGNNQQCKQADYLQASFAKFCLTSGALCFKTICVRCSMQDLFCVSHCGTSNMLVKLHPSGFCYTDPGFRAAVGTYTNIGVYVYEYTGVSLIDYKPNPQEITL